MLDIFKAILTTALIFALAAFVALFVLLGLTTWGRGLPLLGGLPAYGMGQTIQTLIDIRLPVVLGALFAVASALILPLRSAYLDHMLQIFAKGLMLVLTAVLGVVLGHWAYLRLTGTGDILWQRLTPMVAVLAITVAVSLLFRPESLRTSPVLRFCAILVLLVLGPVLLVYFG